MHAAVIDDWFTRSDESKEAQPHWMTPVVTVTPRLEQEFRYDQSWQTRPRSVDVENYGGGKGLELIPSMNTELIIGVPAYQSRRTLKGNKNGWADETFLLKYRGPSANEESGNYIVTGFLGVSVPTGDADFSSRHAIITPALAAGKGWGSRSAGFDIQSTLGIAIPTADKKSLGMPTTWNTAFQLHLMPQFWPELEVNYTHFKFGDNDGKNQTALTVGATAVRFELTSRIRLVVGAGYQKAIGGFRSFNHTWLLTARASF